MIAPVFTPAELAAMVGYQLDPGHSDLDNEQPMSVRVHDGWEPRWLPCRLGDIRAAKRDFYARLQGDLKRDLVMSLLLGALQALVDEQVDYMTTNHLGDPEAQHSVKRAREAIAQAATLKPHPKEKT